MNSLMIIELFNPTFRMTSHVRQMTDMGFFTNT